MVFIMISAMLFALSMLSSVSVPDRYDDPKTTQQLVVNVRGDVS
jgi:hypothetical protein